MREIYDIVTKKTIVIPTGQLIAVCEELGVDYTAISKLTLGNQSLSVNGRLIRPEDKDKIFTLVNFDTGEEYDCIGNASLEHYFGRRLTGNESKYVYELTKERQGRASVCGVVLYKKGSNKITKFQRMKNQTQKCEQIYQYQKLRHKITCILRCRMKNAMRKKASTRSLTGCSYDFLMGYLESKFTKGMSWNNYGDGGWHIDHIRPCASFDLFEEEERRKCFNYTNLQPLWATSKIAKQFGEENYVGNLEKNARLILGGPTI